MILISSWPKIDVSTAISLRNVFGTAEKSGQWKKWWTVFLIAVLQLQSRSVAPRKPCLNFSGNKVE